MAERLRYLLLGLGACLTKELEEKTCRSQLNGIELQYIMNHLGLMLFNNLSNSTLFSFPNITVCNELANALKFYAALQFMLRVTLKLEFTMIASMVKLNMCLRFVFVVMVCLLVLLFLNVIFYSFLNKTSIHDFSLLSVLFSFFSIILIDLVCK